MAPTPVITLTAAPLSVTLAPEVGGSIISFTKEKDGEKINMMHPARDGAVAHRDATSTACYPLVPYSNRIRGGTFSFQGKEWTVPRNHPHLADPLHGEGWQRRWQVEEQSETELLLTFSHDSQNGAFPFSYRAKQQIVLTAEKLSVTMSLTNLSNETFPFGLGLHPFFDKTPDATLTMPNPLTWAHEGQPIPSEPYTTPPEWDFTAPKSLIGLDLDTCFSTPDASARLSWPERKIALNIDSGGACKHMVVYAPPGESFFCVEPVTNANDAFNMAKKRADTGIRRILPEETVGITITFTPEDLT